MAREQSGFSAAQSVLIGSSGGGGSEGLGKQDHQVAAVARDDTLLFPKAKLTVDLFPRAAHQPAKVGLRKPEADTAPGRRRLVRQAEQQLADATRQIEECEVLVGEVGTAKPPAQLAHQ